MLVVGGALGGAPLLAEPYTPKSDDEVLERLPPGVGRPRPVAADQELAQDAENLRASLELAARYLRTAEAEGDARFHGYTRALLRPWWSATPRPPGVALIQARIHLARWEWDEVVATAALVPDTDVNLPAAQVLLFEALLGRGEVERAEAVLSSIQTRLDPRALARARALVARRTGRAEEALQEWSKVLTTLPPDSAHRASDRLFRADLLLQLGRGDEAAEELSVSVREAGTQVDVLEAQADLLLDRRQPAAVIELLRRGTLTDALELRVLEAFAQSPDPDPAEQVRRQAVVREWLERVERRRDRGDVTALPLLVRAYRRVVPDAALALACATEWWEARPDFDSVRGCREAAQNPAGAGLAAAVQQWIDRHRAEDARWAGEATPTTRRGP
ncbi:MAG: hypothetical protein IT580_18795 [Verrucomicrobiales bacterium]|nr:hypothetical protein [Verrucomicrobiales bacterium]